MTERGNPSGGGGGNREKRNSRQHTYILLHRVEREGEGGRRRREGESQARIKRDALILQRRIFATLAISLRSNDVGAADSAIRVPQNALTNLPRYLWEARLAGSSARSNRKETWRRI